MTQQEIRKLSPDRFQHCPFCTTKLPRNWYKTIIYFINLSLTQDLYSNIFKNIPPKFLDFPKI